MKCHISAFALHNVFSVLALAWQVNKHVHIYAGWFAYVAGFIQCNRGLGLVMSTDQLVFTISDVNVMVSVVRNETPGRLVMNTEQPVFNIGDVRYSLW